MSAACKAQSLAATTLLALSLTAHAQGMAPRTIPDYQTREQPDGCLLGPRDFGPPPYSVYRDEEDYAYLADPKRHDDFFDPIKYIRLGGDPRYYLSIGGEIRERWERYSQTDFGIGPQDRSGYFLQRYMLHLDLHLGEFARIFVQFKSDLENSRNGGPRPIDEDKANIHQAYLDLNFVPDIFTLRVGRQELAYGIGRLLDPREGPNVRQSFDGVKGIFHGGGWEADAFLTWLVETNRDRFDNPDPQTKFWGLYATHALPILPHAGIDLYYLGLRRDIGPFNEGVARETRHTLGTRIHGSFDSFDYDVEGGGQFGTFGNGRIGAWYLGTEVGYSFSQALGQPHVALKVDATSGDGKQGDGHLGTFNALFPRGNYLTEPTPIGVQNLIDVHPELDWYPFRWLAVTLTTNFYWRESTGDGIYDAGGFPLLPAGSSHASYVGNETNLVAAWQVNRHTTFTVSYDHFFAGSFIHAVRGAGDFDYVATWLTFKF